MFADVIIDIQHEKLDKIFQYRIPERLEHEVEAGMAVVVPFGKGNRKTKGYVTALSKTCDYDISKVKEIADISRSGVEIETKLIALAAWMKSNYGGTMLQSLKTVLPIKEKENIKVKKRLRLLIDRETGEKQLHYYLEKNQKARARLMAALLDDPLLDYELVRKKLNITATVIRALEEQHVLAVESEQVYRNPVHAENIQKKEIIYTQEQKRAIMRFCKDYENGIRKTYLLHGVTGSGKTEVYMEMIQSVVDKGKQAIVLIPEIALTYQTVMRFYRRFKDRVSVMNSRLSAGERYDQMMRAKAGEVDVMIGPRSALFTPFPNLGLIVIDEEHEPTYKSEQTPRYHARETALRRAQTEGASVVLGSATPSMEAMYRAKNGEYVLMEMKNRSKMQDPAEVYTVDMRKELKNGNRSILSEQLQRLMKERLEKKEQTMLFLNRRGYSGFVSCRECGHVIKCPHCDVSLSVHRDGKMRCHYCGYEQTRVKICPECGSDHIGEFRAGTQQIEEIVKTVFPQARVLRMDQDSTAAKDAHEKLLAKFARHEYDIMVGTQMVAKGLDFEDVTLVGVLGIDSLLFAQGFRAYETVFSLITQVVGRSGRAKDPGFAIIQTTDPDNPVLNLAAAQDYDAFFEQEIAYRKLGLYPPFCGLCVVGFSGPKEIEVARAAARFAALLGRQAAQQPDLPLRVLGPTPGNIEKINENYRYKLTIKCRADRRFRDLVRQTLGLYEQEKLPSKATVVVDMHSDGDI